MASECTHGQVAAYSGPTTAADKVLGSIELPTRPNGWVIDEIDGQVVRQTATAAESMGGHFGLVSVSGDITPDPAPSRFPVFETGSFLGATAPVPVCPRFNYQTDLLAAGKANIDLVYHQAIACTAAAYGNIGIKYGPSITQPRRAKFCDRCRTTTNLTTVVQVGTISLSEKATRITGIMGVLSQDGVLATAQALTGIFSLRSDDVDLVPSFWLFNEVFGAGLGIAIGGGQHTAPRPHEVDIPVPGGARIDCFVDLFASVTNAADVEIFLMYE